MISDKITFDYALELAWDEVDRELSSSPRLIRDYTEHLKSARGKFIRAISLIACAEDIDGFIHQNAVKLAAAIEVLHLATLVHDDVIDNAPKRRGVITLQKKFGRKTAVICGDYLFCAALRLAASVSDKQDYLSLNVPDYMSRVCLGELNQHLNNGNLDLSVYDYLKIISGKTAALFEAAFYAGGVLSEKEASESKKYMRLGRYVGMLFQLNDDCSDFEAAEKAVGKPVKSDFGQGVITLPLIYAFENIKGFKEQVKNSTVSIGKIGEAVLSSGGIGFTRKLSQKYYDKAASIIGELNISENKRKRLKAVADKAFGLPQGR